MKNRALVEQKLRTAQAEHYLRQMIKTAERSREQLKRSRTLAAWVTTLLASGCGLSVEQKLRAATVIYDSAAIVCDVRGTIHSMGNGYSESNPVLGQHPSVKTLEIVAVTDIAITLALAYAPRVPTWLRWGGLSGITLAETYEAIYQPSIGIPLCGG